MTDLYFTRERYQDEIATGHDDWPDYENAVQESIRRIREEDALVREEYAELGTRVNLKDLDKPDDIALSLMDISTKKIVAYVVNEEDETITEEEVITRLEALLNAD